MNGLLGTCASVLATVLTYVAIDTALLYIMWGVGFGMKEITLIPMLPLCLIVAGAGAAVIGTRLLRRHWIAVTATAVACTLLTVPVLGIALFLAGWGCSDGGGCHGALAP